MARWHIELFCYRNILSKLRANELQFNEDAKIPFLLQVVSRTTSPLSAVLLVCVFVANVSNDLRHFTGGGRAAPGGEDLGVLLGTQRQ